MAKNTGNGGGNTTQPSADTQNEIRRARKAAQRNGRRGGGIVPLDETYFGGRQEDIAAARERAAVRREGRAALLEQRAATRKAREEARKAILANKSNLACGAAIKHLRAWAKSQKDWTEEDTAAAVFHLEELFELVWESDPRPRTIVDESNVSKVVKAARLRFAMTCIINRVTIGLKAHQSPWWPDAVAEAEDLCKPKARKPFVAPAQNLDSDTEAATGMQDDTIQLVAKPEPASETSDTEIKPELAAA